MSKCVLLVDMREDIQNMTGRTLQAEQDCQDRTAENRLPELDLVEGVGPWKPGPSSGSSQTP